MKRTTSRSHQYAERYNDSCPNLQGADLGKANIIGASLFDADLEKANLTDTDIEGANFQNADLEGVIRPQGFIIQ